MANTKLLALFPGARLPLIYEQDSVARASSDYGTLQTFFNMDCYENPIGIEIEIEDYQGECPNLMFWKREVDGSLKRQGMEFISIPLKRTMIDYALHEIRRINRDWSYGHRTSTHVHCNVSHYTQEQLVTLVAHYAMLEGLFFSLVDPIRMGNSFCYPIVGTPPMLEFYRGRDGEAQKTTKYCALNIAPVETQMTVEFRHLQGTTDDKTLRRWLQICAKLVYYCGKLDPKQCVNDTIEIITQRKFVEKLPEIWGDTAKIFSSSEVQKSTKAGELWATLLLTGAK